MNLRNLLLLLVCVLNTVVVSASSAAEYDMRYGWPSLRSPKKVIVCKPGSTLQESILLESLSGLAAKAVNANRFDEMVWVDVDLVSYKRIFDESVRAAGITDVKKMDVWDLLSYLKKKGIVKGYVIYNLDANKSGKITDYSSNVATVYASLLNGVQVDASLESKVRKYGLKMLKDARKESVAECFHKNKKRLNNSTALCIHPGYYNLREYAIAHSIMLFADEKELTEEILEWVRPLSPILGWGLSDEYDSTSIISEWGHYNSASNWCHNLSIITALAPFVKLEKEHSARLNDIDFSDTTYVHSFVMSDGDNMQWTMGNFVDNPEYFGHKDVRNTGLSWSLCPINLSVVSPVSYNEVVRRQGAKNTLIEYGGGYQYPDLFAKKRPNRQELLRQFARRINAHMKQLDIKVYGAIFWDVKSAAAQEALQIFAEELEDITGMIAIQYFPYELGKQTFWFKDKRGLDIPVVTADYSLWNEVNPYRPACGTPEFVASLINRDMLSYKSKYSWTIVHAWSDFKDTSKTTPVPAYGVNPVVATENLLIDGIKTVSLNELLWRVRMQYHPDQVKNLVRNK